MPNSSIEAVLGLLADADAALSPPSVPADSLVATAAAVPADEVYEEHGTVAAPDVARSAQELGEFAEADDVVSGSSEQAELVMADDLHVYCTDAGAAGLLLAAAAAPNSTAAFISNLEAEYRSSQVMQQALCANETWNNFPSDAYRALACVAAERAGVARAVTKNVRSALDVAYFQVLRA